MRVMYLWNTHACPMGFEKLEYMPTSRRRVIRELAEEKILVTEPDWIHFIASCNTPYLIGDVEDKHPAGPSHFDWLTDSPKRVTQVLEGRYAEKKAPADSKRGEVDEIMRKRREFRERIDASGKSS